MAAAGKKKEAKVRGRQEEPQGTQRLVKLERSKQRQREWNGEVEGGGGRVSRGRSSWGSWNGASRDEGNGTVRWRREAGGAAGDAAAGEAGTEQGETKGTEW
ncbi:hypothetical protein NDU88_006058 [Pleurodeles waltl]|uniref:Uncharacterized protein n=1 Tax=Pleurodeles waltl TaxID=8319 RepID=A0AAV7LPJ2_PLEWA|nr:hypothetical protein NDU88_006058 [Pleurodeles waltl]